MCWSHDLYDIYSEIWWAFGWIGWPNGLGHGIGRLAPVIEELSPLRVATVVKWRHYSSSSYRCQPLEFILIRLCKLQPQHVNSHQRRSTSTSEITIIIIVISISLRPLTRVHPPSHDVLVACPYECCLDPRQRPSHNT